MKPFTLLKVPPKTIKLIFGFFHAIKKQILFYIYHILLYFHHSHFYSICKTQSRHHTPLWWRWRRKEYTVSSTHWKICCQSKSSRDTMGQSPWCWSKMKFITSGHLPEGQREVKQCNSHKWNIANERIMRANNNPLGDWAEIQLPRWIVKGPNFKMINLNRNNRSLEKATTIELNFSKIYIILVKLLSIFDYRQFNSSNVQKFVQIVGNVTDGRKYAN